MWKEEFHEELSDAEAEAHGLRLLSLFSMLSRPLPSSLNNAQDVKASDFDKFPQKRTIEE